jgi:hypothetical protein
MPIRYAHALPAVEDDQLYKSDLFVAVTPKDTVTHYRCDLLFMFLCHIIRYLEYCKRKS